MNALFETLTGLTLLDPWLLLLALLVPLVFAFRCWRTGPAVRFAPAEFTAGLPHTWRLRLLAIPPALQYLALLLLVLALARPVHRAPLPPLAAGIDILLCLDTSSSMTSRDLDPQRPRLEVAKAAAAQFIAGRPTDRIGLLTFARYPDVRCPLTLDHRALAELLAEVQVVAGDSPEDATGIGTAVARAAAVLRASTARSKVVILLTDGEENVATAQTPDEIAPLHSSQLCLQLGVRVYTIAAGRGNPGPAGVWQPLDTGQVQRLAERTGGRFYASHDGNALASVYAEIGRLETVEFAEPTWLLEERFVPFVLVAIALVLVGRLLQATWLTVLP
ncbi:MAG TPA: VWA domain-containing protein [Planctomycetota bacterium]|nr:VWA domain-containing protein [Planctomycetota bacterium]